MNVALRAPRMTREQFFDWAEAQDERYEFDGFQPVAMTGGNALHNEICHNIYLALGPLLRSRGCRVRGPDVGLATIGDRVRYPDVLINCTRTAPTARVIDGALAVFEVLSPGSGHVDRIIKVREYAAVPSIRRYVILEHRSVGATVHVRADGDTPWTATTLVAGDSLDLAEVAISVPLLALYADTELAPAPEDSAPRDGP